MHKVFTRSNLVFSMSTCLAFASVHGRRRIHHVSTCRGCPARRRLPETFSRSSVWSSHRQWPVCSAQGVSRFRERPWRVMPICKATQRSSYLLRALVRVLIVAEAPQTARRNDKHAVLQGQRAKRRWDRSLHFARQTRSFIPSCELDVRLVVNEHAINDAFCTEMIHSAPCNRGLALAADNLY